VESGQKKTSIEKLSRGIKDAVLMQKSLKKLQKVHPEKG
jgi:hypothetical protein